MRSKSIHFKNSNQESFIKEFARLYTRVAPWQAWSDFVTLSAISIANPFDKTGTIHNNREQEYLNIIKKYKEEEQQIFPKLFALLVDALEEYPEQDFLGEIFMALGLGSHWKGQFFTPYDVCKLMAIVSTADMRKDVQKCGWVSVCDMCCGAGALLIAARNEMQKNELGSHQVLFVAQDIDRTVALMCYLQLSLLGCAGYIIVGDSLLNPPASPTGSPLLIKLQDEQEIWLTPAFYDKVWLYRTQIEKLNYLTTIKRKE